MLGLGAGGLPHIEAQLEPETCDHLQGRTQRACRTDTGGFSARHPPTSALLAPPSLYLSGGVADAVQGEQVRRVRDGVILGDGDSNRRFKVL